MRIGNLLETHIIETYNVQAIILTKLDFDCAGKLNRATSSIKLQCNFCNALSFHVYVGGIIMFILNELHQSYYNVLQRAT